MSRPGDAKGPSKNELKKLAKAAEKEKKKAEKQAQEQIAIQVNEVLPVPLAKQAGESRRLLGEVQNALANSYV